MASPPFGEEKGIMKHLKNIGWSLLCAVMCVGAMLFGGWLEHGPLSYVMGGVACFALAMFLLRRINELAGDGARMIKTLEGVMRDHKNKLGWAELFNLRRLYPDVWVSAHDTCGRPFKFESDYGSPSGYLAYQDDRGICKIVMLGQGELMSVWDGYLFNVDAGALGYRLSDQLQKKGGVDIPKRVGWNQVEDIPGHGRTFIPARNPADAIEAYLKLKGRKSPA